MLSCSHVDFYSGLDSWPIDVKDSRTLNFCAIPGLFGQGSRPLKQHRKLRSDAANKLTRRCKIARRLKW